MSQRNDPTTGGILASAVAALFATGLGCDFVGDEGSTARSIVKCSGINECRGQGQCGGVNADGSYHGCEGTNACRGEGWIEVARAECDEKGGSVIE